MAVNFERDHAELDVTSLHHRRATHRWERTSVGDLLERMTWSFPDQEAMVGQDGAYGDEAFHRAQLRPGRRVRQPARQRRCWPAACSTATWS